MKRLLTSLCTWLAVCASSGVAIAQETPEPAPATPEPEPAPAGEDEEQPGKKGESLQVEDAKPDKVEGEAEGPKRVKGPLSWQDIVVVPRKAFLKNKRTELMPFTGVSINDLLIRHYAFGADFNFFLTDVLSVGVQGQYFIKTLTARENVIGLQFNRIPTLNRYMFAAALNFGYVPIYGKFALFNKHIFHWEIFASGGIGITRTEIIPRYPSDQTFTTDAITPNFALGGRFFMKDWLTINFAFRDYVFQDKFEPTSRMRGQDIADVKAAADTHTVNNVMLYLGIGIFLPTSFQYRTSL